MIGGAPAADLPAKSAMPVQYIRICSTYGTGFFYITGTETRLRFGGRVRAEYLYVEPTDRPSIPPASAPRGAWSSIPALKRITACCAFTSAWDQPAAAARTRAVASLP